MKKRLTITLLASLGALFCAFLLTASGPPANSAAIAAASSPKPAAGQEFENLHLEDMRSPIVFDTDHFKVYLIEPQPVEFKVLLRGQFDGNAFLTVKPIRYTRFLNPVDKNGEGIIDKNNHLDWYDIEIEKPDPNRQVVFTNQFGLQTIKIGQPVALLAPTQKLEPGSQFPQKLNHYKVYEVLDAEDIGKTVVLKDQFGEESNVAIIARYFAVPVEKRHDNAYYPIIYPNDHLVFYILDPKDWSVYRRTRDQFGLHDMRTLWSEMLGVPTRKIAWEE